jgi:antitoxin ParD1/3/4
MTIHLTVDQEAWIKEHVEAGEFASVEEAVRVLLDERIAQRELEDDDMAWAIPLIEEGLASVETHGEISLEEFKARSAARLAALMNK